MVGVLPQNIVVVKWGDLLTTTCNMQLHDFIGLLRTIRLVVLNISVFQFFKAEVLTFSEQIKPQHMSMWYLS